MTTWRVINVIDGDTFDVHPTWVYGDKEGRRVRIANVNAPEPGILGATAATSRLTNAIYGRDVELNGQAIDVYGRLVATVALNGLDVSSLV